MPMNPNVGAALIQGGANAAQGLVGLIQQKKQNEANMKMAEYQYSKDLEMWNRGNTYNAPEAQMQRLKAAGLNPNLVYGQGAPGQSAGALPKYNAPTLDYSYQPPIAQGAANMLSQYQDFQIKQAQINNLREQNKVIRESGIQKEWVNKYFPTFAEQRKSAGMYAGQRALIAQETEAEKLEQLRGLFPSQLEFAKGKVRYQDQQIDNMLKAGRKIDASTDYQNKVNEWYLTKMFSQLGIQAAGQVAKFIPGVKEWKSFNTNKRNVKDAENWRTFEQNRGRWIGN